MKESEGPDVKSIVTDLPSAESGGQLPNQELVHWSGILQEEV